MKSNPGIGPDSREPTKQYPGLIPARKGEVRNPTGRNGAEWLTAFKHFFQENHDAELDGPDGDPKESRFKNSTRALYKQGLVGNVRALEVIHDQLCGKAKTRLELTGADGGPLEAVNYTTAEKRALLERMLARQMAEPEDGKEPDASAVKPSEGDPIA